MLGKSHVDINKLNKVPSGNPFEYKAVVSDELPISEHSTCGRVFKEEVDSGKYENIVVYKDTESHIVYKKLSSET